VKPDRKEILVTLVASCVAVPVLVVSVVLLLAPGARVEEGPLHPGHARAAMCAAGVAEWLALSLVVPAWSRRYGLTIPWLFLAVFVLVGMLTCFAFPAGRAVGPGAAALHAYLFGYGAAVWGLAVFVARLAGRGWVGQAVAAAVSVVLAANVVIVNLVLECSGSLRDAMIAGVLATNPMTASGAALGYDAVRGGAKIMYETSHIAYYNFSYPPWYVTSGLHLVLGAILFGVAAGVFGRKECGEC
jgi:hypothetical protein